MRVLYTGHRYALRHLKGDGETVLQFHMDPKLHQGQSADGPSTQEVLRACIDRTRSLHGEKPWDGNVEIIRHLRMAIALFEARALLRKTEKGLPIDDLPVGDDGHLVIKCNTSS